MSAIISAALALARQGLPVVPWSASKKPVTPHGFLDASTDPVEVQRLFSRPGAALVVVRMGEPSRLVALDFDTEDTARAWWRAHHHRLPDTRTHRTRRGGLHLLFAWPGGKVPSPAGKLALGVDVRGDGSALTWWPAHGGDVVRDMPLDGLPLFPGWVLDAITPPPPPPLPPTRLAVSDRYAAAALERAIVAVATAAEGTRNSTLNREAHGLARLVGPVLTARDIAAALIPAAQAAGLQPHETMLTVSSALRARGVA
ncbi:bifunctional DNA primase/polymerase [Elioraea rosea]|uniref:bifunctional DNA primase/polymerase n=1 Tax=Elioraea rosea TaxID=2492390 RepID=UPI0011830A10|nr:bifunctional DNA primase/polymerase [Elioraea rosea]